MNKLFSLLCVVFSLNAAAIEPSPIEPKILDLGQYFYVNSANDIYESIHREDFKNCSNNGATNKALNKICEAYDLIKQFPNGGLYSKRANEHIWSGPNLLDAYISHDGHRLIGFGYSNALAFYHDGNLIAYYSINDLMDDRRKIYEKDRWVQYKEFDNNKNQLSITTVDNNYYVFDVLSGKIIQFKQLPDIHMFAQVDYDTGRQDNVQIQTNCKPDGNYYDIDYFSVATDASFLAAASNWSESDIIKLFLNENVELSKHGTTQQGDFIWKVKQGDSSQQSSIIINKFYELCVKSSNNSAALVPIKEFKKIKLSAQKYLPDRVIPLLETRMRWDTRHIDSARAKYCQSIQIKVYNSIDFNRQLLRRLDANRCEHSEHYNQIISLMKEWVIKQPINFTIEGINNDLLVACENSASYSDMLTLLENREFIQHVTLPTIGGSYDLKKNVKYYMDLSRRIASKNSLAPENEAKKNLMEGLSYMVSALNNEVSQTK